MKTASRKFLALALSMCLLFTMAFATSGMTANAAQTWSRVEIRFQTAASCGIVFNAEATSDYQYVWGVNNDFTIRRHSWKNGNWITHEAFNFRDKVDESTFYSTAHVMTVDYTDDIIITYLDDVEVDRTTVISAGNPIQMVSNPGIGVRNHQSAGSYDWIKYSSYEAEESTPIAPSPTLIFFSDFSNDVCGLQYGSFEKRDGNGWYDLPASSTDMRVILSAADMVASQGVYDAIDAIPAIGSITAADAAQITAARWICYAANSVVTSLVDNGGYLFEAEDMLYELMAFTEPMISAAIAINLLSTKAVSLNIADELKAVRADVDALSPEDRDKLLNVDLLEAIEAEYKELGNKYSVTITGWADPGLTTRFRWMNSANVSEADKIATRAAMADEIKARYALDAYELMPTGTTKGIDAWMCNNWSQAVWGAGVGQSDFRGGDSVIVAPFVGVAISLIKHASDDINWRAMLGSSFEMNGKMYAIYWDNIDFYYTAGVDETIGDPKPPRTTIDLFPGKYEGGGELDTNNTFRYAYAMYNQANKWDRKNMGIPADFAFITNDVVHQLFETPEGAKYIAASHAVVDAETADPHSGKQVGAYIIDKRMASAIRSFGIDDAERFTILGAPLGNEYVDGDNLSQDFVNGTLSIDASGKIVGDFANMYELSISISDAKMPATDGAATKYDAVWSAAVLVADSAEPAALTAFNNADTKILEYGVYYDLNADAVSRWAELGNDSSLSGKLKKAVFDSGSDIDMNISFSFRLKNCLGSSQRAAMFYIIYEVDGTRYTASSIIDSIE